MCMQEEKEVWHCKTTLMVQGHMLELGGHLYISRLPPTLHLGLELLGSQTNDKPKADWFQHHTQPHTSCQIPQRTYISAPQFPSGPCLKRFSYCRREALTRFSFMGRGEMKDNRNLTSPKRQIFQALITVL